MIHGEEKLNETETKETEKKIDSSRPDNPESKSDGIANDLVSAVEPFMRAGEKLFGIDRAAVGTQIVRSALGGKLNIAGLFPQQKKTRLEKVKELLETTLYIMLLLMLFFWVNFAIAKFLGVV